MKISPLARSVSALIEDGWTVDVVERRIPGANRTRDLFGLFDLVAVKGDRTLGVQVTDATNVSHRVRKIEQSPNLRAVIDAGWSVVVHGWYADGRCRVLQRGLDEWIGT